ncbi:hypothetical protein GSF70_17285 [Flavobacteriaceae bacterium W22]|nr:hypothetical protein [Flavobacteriaceae bacterium W22]
MNSYKNNLDHQIKEQISGREISPSRDLWSEIQAQTENTYSKKSNLNPILLAACFVLLFGLGTVLFLTNETEPKIQIAETEKSSTQKEDIVLQPATTFSQNAIVTPKQEKFTQIKNSPGLKNEKEIPVNTDLPLIKENPTEVASQIIQNQPSKIIAKADSIKAPKKKRYVDPSTLLFSVEHKDAIEKTKDGSNVAKIDLNAK